MRSFFRVVVLSLLAAAATAQPPRSVTVTAAAEPPEIDGRLDDAAWSAAAVVDGFRQVFPAEGEPTEATRVFVTFDAGHLYVGARLADAEPEKIVASQLIQGSLYLSDDRFWIVIDTFLDRRNGYTFQLNPNGVRREGLWENNSRFIEDWDAIWRGAARIDDEGWTVEMAIPVKSLSFDPTRTSWGINFGRYVARKDETQLWSSAGQKELVDVPAFAGTVHGLEGLRQGVGLDVVASGIASYSDPGAGGAGDDTELEPALDLFYKPTSSLTAALTVNTDFSATEVDDRQINLTRFSLFFPEKRDFFLQDAGIFEFGGLDLDGRPFFSRRVGLAAGQPLDIRVGGKLTGRVGRFNVGFLDVLQEDPGGGDENLVVGRVTYNLLEGSYLGAIVTHGDPTSAEDNTVAGLDFRYRTDKVFGAKALGGQVFESGAWFQRSSTSGSARDTGDEDAYGFLLSYPNDRHFARLSYSRFGEGFHPGLGLFLRGPGRIFYNLQYTRRVRPEKGRFKLFDAGIWWDEITDLDHELETRNFFFFSNLQVRGSDVLTYEYFLDKEVIDFAFPIFRDEVHVLPGTYTFAKHSLFLKAARHRPLRLELSVGAGEFYGGDQTSFGALVEWQRFKRFFLSLRYDQGQFDLPEETGTAALPVGDFITRLVQLRFNVAFDARWSWSNLVQYDNDSDELGVNSRLRFNPRAGREIFLVINQNYRADPGNRFQEVFTGLVLKASYTFRF